MKLKITAKGNVYDTQADKNLSFGDIIEREEKRGQIFIDRGLAVEIKETKEIKEIEVVSKEVEPEKKTRKKRVKKA